MTLILSYLILLPLSSQPWNGTCCLLELTQYMLAECQLSRDLTARAQGFMVNETKCLGCETVTSREEAFYDLSLEIEQNSSLTACLRNFRFALTSQAPPFFTCCVISCNIFLLNG